MRTPVTPRSPSWASNSPEAATIACRRVTGVDRAAEVQRAPCLVDADERSLSHGLQIAGEPIRDPLELDRGCDGPALDVDLVHGREPFLWRHSGIGDDDCTHLAREITHRGAHRVTRPRRRSPYDPRGACRTRSRRRRTRADLAGERGRLAALRGRPCRRARPSRRGRLRRLAPRPPRAPRVDGGRWRHPGLRVPVPVAPGRRLCGCERRGAERGRRKRRPHHAVLPERAGRALLRRS